MAPDGASSSNRRYGCTHQRAADIGSGPRAYLVLWHPRGGPPPGPWRVQLAYDCVWQMLTGEPKQERNCDFPPPLSWEGDRQPYASLGGRWLSFFCCPPCMNPHQHTTHANTPCPNHNPACLHDSPHPTPPSSPHWRTYCSPACPRYHTHTHITHSGPPIRSRAVVAVCFPVLGFGLSQGKWQPLLGGLGCPIPPYVLA